ncbi:MAG: class I SAM-dependent methyltransferase [Luteimonas sp.]|nr:class I SAM-dependent methyltransferase [Luteimonas sp.]
MSKPALFPEGHYYSPVVDTDEACRDAGRIWPGLQAIPGIDMQEERQRRLLADHFPALLRHYAYPRDGPPDEEVDFFYERNSQFAWFDSRALFCLLQIIRPRRVVEVGSGYSSLLMSDVNERFLAGAARICCIEPYPRPFLEQGDRAGLYELLKRRVQDVDISVFTDLGEGDLLFIDSSHVCKTGSDVAHLYLNVLPRLKPGVYIHVHDVFLPEDYRQDWVVDENRSWNEQYVLHALLAENPNFEVIFGSHYAFRRFPELIASALGTAPYGGSSFWFRRRGGSSDGLSAVAGIDPPDPNKKPSR